MTTATPPLSHPLSHPLSQPLSQLDLDGQLQQRVNDALSNNPYLVGRQWRIETAAGHVIVKGQVGTFFQKQMAQESLRKVDGVMQIQNELIVC